MNRTGPLSSSLPETLKRSPFRPHSSEMDVIDHFSYLRLSGSAVAQNFQDSTVDQAEAHLPSVSSPPERLRRHSEHREVKLGVWMTVLLILYTAFFIVMYNTTPGYLKPASDAHSQSAPAEKAFPITTRKTNVDMIKSLLP